MRNITVPTWLMVLGGFFAIVGININAVLWVGLWSNLLLGYAAAFAVDILINIFLFYALPKRIVREYPNRYFKGDPNWMYFVEKAGEVVRIIPGQNWVLAGNNINSAEDMEISERISAKQDCGGGERSEIVRILEDWIFFITGYRVVALTFTDLWNAEVKVYDLGRNKVLEEYAGKVPDLSNHIVLAPQIYKTKIKELETTRLMQSEGSEDQAERIPIDMELSFAYQITNALHITRGTNWKYFPFVFDVLKTAVQDGVKFGRLSFDDTISEEGGEKIIAYVLGRNEVGIKLPADEAVRLRKPEMGTRERYGFKFTQLLIGNISPAESYRESLAAQQKARLAAEAQITTATLGVKLAEKNLLIAELNAKASVAPMQHELRVLNEGARAMQGGRDGLEDSQVTNILIAKERRRGLSEFKGGTLVINENGNQTLTTIPVGRESKGDNKEPKEGAK